MRPLGRRVTVSAMAIATVWRRVEPVTDPALAAALLAFGLYDISMHVSDSSFPGSPMAHAVFLAVSVLPLAWRRRTPLAVLLAVMSATLVWTYALYSLDQQGPLEGFIALVVAVYTAAAYTSGSAARASAAIVSAGLLAGVVSGLAGGEPAGNILPFTLWIIVSYGIGRILRRRQLVAAQLGQQVSLLEREREQRVQQAVADERARIARELHDVIAHSVSVMVVQAGAGERVLEQEPEQARQALLSIRETGSQTLVEMRRLLGLLRHTEEALSFAPQPGIARLGILVEEVRAAGLPTQLQVEGQPKPLAPGIELSAYRIVQEALTNVRKHAGPANAEVLVGYGAHEVTLEIRDDGIGPGNRASSGHGLIGMRERVALYDGSLETGPRPGGGFLVRARLPLQHQPA